MKIRHGDTVVIITGKDKGKTGTVLRVLPSRNRVVVSGVNMRTKHIRRTPQRAGQIVRYEAALHLSNVMLVDPKTKKRTRVGFTMDEKGRKVRIAKRSGEVIVAGTVAPKAAPQEKAKPKEGSGKPAEGKMPFWKKMGFGKPSDHIGDREEPSHMQEDHSVPEQSQIQNTRAHSRGS